MRRLEELWDDVVEAGPEILFALFLLVLCAIIFLPLVAA